MMLKTLCLRTLNYLETSIMMCPKLEKADKFNAKMKNNSEVKKQKMYGTGRKLLRVEKLPFNQTMILKS